MHTLDRLKHMLPDQEWTVDAKPLMFLDLKLGNICNLKCRICEIGRASCRERV
jgi:MoaA/NifB/PqqE/SkfB family radical SAM enzyme